ncbi:hypothetical protein [Brevibacillus dissolubilis]|uniref:hypothetical protein n=1 Tax=Brevibacillus dissolubilis TaxID=1844116 RepID=UPI0011163D53|nr:hypothetical protein [Brevibacillus dissolubilis]
MKSPLILLILTALLLAGCQAEATNQESQPAQQQMQDQMNLSSSQTPAATRPEEQSDDIQSKLEAGKQALQDGDEALALLIFDQISKLPADPSRQVMIDEAKKYVEDIQKNRRFQPTIQVVDDQYMIEGIALDMTEQLLLHNWGQPDDEAPRPDATGQGLIYPYDDVTIYLSGQPRVIKRIEVNMNENLRQAIKDWGAPATKSFGQEKYTLTGGNQVVLVDNQKNSVVITHENSQ